MLVGSLINTETASGTGREQKRSSRCKGQNLSGYNPLAPNAGPKERTSYESNPGPGLRPAPKQPAPLCAPFPGSMTVEAAVVMPLCLLCCVFFLRFFLLLGFQIRLQDALENAAGEMAMTAGAAGVNSELEGAWQVLLTRELAISLLGEKTGMVEGGAAGLDFSESFVDVEEQKLFLTVRYQAAFPSGFAGTFYTGGCQMCVRRLWTGTEGTSWEVSAPEEETEERIVYVTENGTAYHLFSDCTYLAPSVRRVSGTSIPSLRSEDGSIYYPCTYCHASSRDQTVYVTDYGDRYHSTLTCSRLARSVKAIPESKADGRHLCSKCAARGK